MVPPIDVVNTHRAADIQQSELSTFEFWAQYAAAAYCHDSYASQTPHKITCWAGNCPQVEADGATIVFDFSKLVQEPTEPGSTYLTVKAPPLRITQATSPQTTLGKLSS